jgi:hypothetical protein
MQFLQALVDEMDRRFPKEELAVIKNFSTIAFPDYGLKELKQLHTRFANCLGSFEEIRLEYSQLLPSLTRSFQTTIKGRVATVQDVMTELVKPDRSISFVHCSHLLAIAMVLPVATAECERGFSTMKRMKTSSCAIGWRKPSS